ncbi:MAG TPA: DUF4214 domain-containing protein [Usitatibacter sp.]|nr:DUF4214 domain-containing protein [Usitatibacter sp.]
MPAATPDIDRILEAIRAEARARGSKGAVGSFSSEAGAATVHLASHGLPGLDLRHAADFLALPLDAFLGAAYRQLLGREPDSGGAAHYQRALLRGALTRIEVLGRLAFSGEGRRRARPVPGLALAFLLATGYRVPVAGPLAALAARLLRLPAHLQDRSTLEAAALASGSWMKR